MDGIAQLSFAADLRGAMKAAVLFFGVIPAVLLMGATAEWRRARSGSKIALSLATVALVLAAIYRSWFGATHCSIERLPPGNMLRLTMALPERSVTIPASAVSAVTDRPGPRGVGVRVTIESDGRRLVSPTQYRSADAYAALHGLLDTARIRPMD
jgi:hypothetical protein